MLDLKSVSKGLLVVLLLALAINATDSNAATPAAPTASPSQIDLGPNVKIFDPSMPVSQIQATVDAIANQQVPNQFGPERYALLFKPGTYGTATNPLNFQVGYYTEVAGLGASPTDVVINGSIYVRNQCDSSGCIALNNFWRSLSNLTINVTTPNFGCYSGEFWAVSQAAPMRRVNVTGGNVTLMDYCSGPSFASGGFIADSQTGFIINGSQQQFFVRNSKIGGWSNGVWNQVFSGVQGAPDQCFPQVLDNSKNPPAVVCGPYTTLPTSPITREKPFLYSDAAGKYAVFVPAVRHNSVGPSWTNGPAAGTSISIDKFYVAKPGDSVKKINKELENGKHLLLTPGVYHLDRAIKVKRADTVVLGLGFATLIPDNGNVALSVADVKGVKLAGLLFDAGPVNSPVLLQLGSNQNDEQGDASDQHDGNKHSDAISQNAASHDQNNTEDNNEQNDDHNDWKSDPNDPSTISDVFFRIGGANPGKATTSLIINSDNVLLDDIWAWRADHGNGVGWTLNTADTGLIVNGANVTAYGLFVEHYQKYEVIWKGNNGTVIFFQNELPYDPPNQAAWNHNGIQGWAALKVADNVTQFSGYGMGSYSFFNQGVDIFAAHAFEVPTTLPAGSLHDMLTIFLDASHGKGGILHVVNDTGGSSTISNPDAPVTVVSYP